MSFHGNSRRRIRMDSLRVEPAHRPDWLNGADNLPAVGDEVYCAEGAAEVTRILGKTGDGTRLLELALRDRPEKPFFAAASNVLVAPRRR